ncbi:DUF1156 domain-containing protein [Candidatus Binatus soli]
MHSALEKSVRHGHPSTLHLWCARRPPGRPPRNAAGAAAPRPVR